MVKPVRFIKSLYYANKGNMIPKKQPVIDISKDVNEQICQKLVPYYEGYRQLAEKYKFKVFVDGLNEKKELPEANIILSNKNKTTNIKVDTKMEPAEIARNVYRTVSEHFIK